MLFDFSAYPIQGLIENAKTSSTADTASEIAKINVAHRLT
jgi:hypothetical protein